MSQTAHKPATPPALAARVIGTVKRNKRLVQFAVLALIAVFFALGVRKSWSNLANYSWDVHWGLFAAAFALFAAQELSYALIWRGILARLGSRLDVVSSERIYLTAEFVRYIPGNVWHVVARVLGAERRGVPKAIGFASMVIELATKIVSAALVFAISLLFWPNVTALTAEIPRDVVAGIGVVGVPLLLLGLHPKLLQALLNRGLQLLKRDPVVIRMSYRDILVITLYWAVSWAVVGAGFYLLILSITGQALPVTALVLAAGIYALGWDIGFLSFITPSGVGFREAALIALLLAAGLVPAGVAAFGLATVIAFLARLLSTASEVVCISAAYLAPGGRGSLPARVPEPAAEG